MHVLHQRPVLPSLSSACPACRRLLFTIQALTPLTKKERLNYKMIDIEYIKKKFLDGEYSISDHAIIEARKDGIEPNTVEKLEWVAINGKVIEEYIDRQRILI